VSPEIGVALGDALGLTVISLSIGRVAGGVPEFAEPDGLISLGWFFDEPEIIKTTTITTKINPAAAAAMIIIFFLRNLPGFDAG